MYSFFFRLTIWRQVRGGTYKYICLLHVAFDLKSCIFKSGLAPAGVVAYFRRARCVEKGFIPTFSVPPNHLLEVAQRVFNSLGGVDRPLGLRYGDEPTINCL